MKTEGGYLVGRIKLLSGRRLNRLFTENGLHEFKGEQGKILYSLWKKDGISSSDISEDTGLALNTLTSMLDLMEKNGLLYREQSAEDKRKKLVLLTEKGKSLEKKTKKLNRIMDGIFYKGFSNDEIVCFEKMLRRIVQNLTEGE